MPTPPHNLVHARQQKLNLAQPIFMEITDSDHKTHMYESHAGDAALAYIQAVSYCIRHRLTPNNIAVVTP